MTKNNKAFFISIIIMASSLSCAALSNMALFADGANWLFEFLRSGNFYYDYGFNRFSDLLIQIPVFISLKAFGTEVGPGFYRTIWNLCYLLHPILSLIICFLVLSNKSKSLCYFPLLGVSVCLAPTIIFSVGVAPSTLSLSWMAWSLIVSKDNSTLRRLLLLSILFLLMFSYETSFLILLAFVPLMWKKDISIKEKTAWSILLIGQALVLIYFISTHLGEQTDRFWSSLPFAFSFWKVICCLCVIFLPFLAHFKIGPKIIYSSFLVLILYFLTEWENAIDLWSSYNFRTLSVPLTSVLMVTSILYLKANGEKNVKNLEALALSACFFSSIALFFSSMKWSKSLDEVLIAVKSHEGCVYRTYEGYGLSDLTISKHFFTPLSIVLQNSWRIDPVLLTPITDKDRKIGEPCRLIDGKTNISNMEFRFGHSQTFKFPFIKD